MKHSSNSRVSGYHADSSLNTNGTRRAHVHRHSAPQRSRQAADKYYRYDHRSSGHRKFRRRRRKRCILFLIAVGILIFATLFLRPVIRESNLRNSGCPDSFVDLAEHHPEAYNFAADYQKNKDKEETIDIRSEVHKGKIPLFMQWDERWGYHLYGDDFLALTGCGPVSLSMVYSGLTGSTEWNPLKMAQWAEANGYYVDGSGTSWRLMDDGAKLLGLDCKEMAPSADRIESELKKGNVIIGIMGPGDFTNSGHFIVLTGIVKKDQVSVNDPNSKVNSGKTWSAGTLASQMQDMWVYD